MNLRFFNSFYSLIALAIPTQTYSSPFNFFQQRPGDKGNGNCHNTGNLYADALVASHASYHAFRSFEHAARHPNPASLVMACASSLCGDGSCAAKLVMALPSV